MTVPFLPHRVPWVRQPNAPAGINWSNPLTQGLVLLWNPAENAVPKVTGSISRAYRGAGFSKTGGKTFSPPAFTGAWDVVHHNGLTGYRNTVSGTGYIDLEAGAVFNPDVGDCSFFSINRFHDSTIDHCIWGVDGTSQVQIWADTDTTQLKLNIYDGATVSSAAVDSLDNNDRDYKIAFTWDDGTKDAFAYIDGLQVITDADFWPSATPDGNLQLNATEDVNKIGDQSIYLVAIWDRPLSAAEVWSLNVNPWQLFMPRETLLPAFFTTGGVTITDVNTTESWTDGDTGLVITGTGFV